MVLCVWFPDWSLRNTPSDEACFAVAGTRVVAATEPASRAGVRAGLTRREAEALCPEATVLVQDEARDLTDFEPVVEALEAIVPRVEIVEPGLALVALDGALSYFGDLDTVVGRLRDAASTAAPVKGRFGVAQGPSAARWAAQEDVAFVRDDASFLASLDVGVLEASELVDTFRWLGIRTLGDLSRLPRAAVASRFGTDGLEAHRLASGEDRLPSPRELPADLAVEDSYTEPLTTLDQVGFAARRLTHRLMTALRGAAPHRIEIEAEAGAGSRRVRVWRSADPFNSATLTERVWWQLRAWTESGGVPGGLVRLRITPGDISPEGRQLGLLEDTLSQETERAVARAQSLLGMDSVLSTHPQGGRDPADRVVWHRWGEETPSPARSLEAPWPGSTPSPSPSLVPPEPQPLTLEWEDGIPVRMRLRSRWEEVIGWSGPWRRTGRWWADEADFDRYQVVTSVGAFLCEVRDGLTYLVGIYD